METTDRSWAGPWASVKFTGSISSQFDGENTEGEGTLSFPDGRTAELSFSGSASARGAEYVLDGEPVDPGSETQTHLDTLFENIWPDFESDFEGLKIVDNEVYG